MVKKGKKYRKKCSQEKRTEHTHIETLSKLHSVANDAECVCGAQS